MISKSKFDNSFPDSQFFLDKYSSPYNPLPNKKGEGIMLVVRNGIPSKMISIEKLLTERFLVEFNL